MKKGIYICIALCAAMLFIGCSSGSDYTGMTLFEALAAADESKYGDFIKGFDENKYTAVDYYGGSGSVFHTENVMLIKTLYNELSRTRLESRYKNRGVSSSDAGERLIFSGNDGSTVDFSFEKHRVYAGGEYYNCSNENELKKITEQIKERNVTSAAAAETSVSSYAESTAAVTGISVTEISVTESTASVTESVVSATENSATENSATETSATENSATETSVTESSAQVGASDDFEGMFLFEALAAADQNRYGDFIKGFDENKFTAAEYYFYGVSGAEYRTGNRALIKELYNALSRTKLDSRYNGDEQTSDAEETLVFVGRDGSEISFSFDYHRVSVGGGLYCCSNEDELKKLTEKIREWQVSSGMSVIEAYAYAYGEPYMTLMETGFVPDDYEKAYYNVFGEGYEEYPAEDKELMKRLYDALSEVKITGLYDGPEATDRGEAFVFVDTDGNELVFSFDFGNVCINNELYECDGEKALQRVKREIMT